MSFTFVSQAAAERRARELNASAGENVTYVAAQYPDGTNFKGRWPWGIVRRFRYADRPELGWFGAAFVWEADRKGV